MGHDLAVKNLSDLAPSRLGYAMASHPAGPEPMALVDAFTLGPAGADLSSSGQQAVDGQVPGVDDRQGDVTRAIGP